MKMMLHSFLLAALVLVTVPGCGSGSSGNSDDPTPGGTPTGSEEIDPDSPPEMGDSYSNEAATSSGTPSMNP